MGYTSGTKWTYELVNETLKSINYYLVDTEYINANTKLTFYDGEGYYYFLTLPVILRGNPLSKFHQYNPYTIHNIRLWCKLNNKPFELISTEYNNAKTKMQWRCLKQDCGELFWANWSDIYSGNGCGVCAGAQVTLSNCLATKRSDLIKEWHPTLNGDLTPYNVTYGCNEYVWWKCKDCGHEWYTPIYSRSCQNRGCPCCAGQVYSETNNLLVYNPKMAEEWDYDKNEKRPEECCPKSGKPVWWKCKECGYEWFVSPSNRNRNNSGCPKCTQTKGEKQVDIILTKYNIPHDSQYTFDDLKGINGGLLRFDVPVFWDKEKTQLRMLIEFDGIFHFEKVYEGDGHETIVIHDELKNEYCKKHNIILIRIPYWEFDNIETILKNELKIKEEL